MGLARAIELALQGNPALVGQQQAITVAQAQRDQRSAAQWPSIKAVTGITEFRREQRLVAAAAPNEPAILTQHILGGDLVATWPLYSGHRLSATRRLADQTVKGSQFDYERARAEVVFRVTELHNNILAQQALCDAIASSEAALSRHHERLLALVAEGKAAPLDAQRAAVRLSALRQLRAREANREAVMTLGLASLLGRDGTEQPIKVVGLLDSDDTGDLPELESIASAALTRRPDYLAAQAERKGQDYQIAVAKAGRLPSLALQAQTGLRWGLWPSVDLAESENPAEVGQVGLVLEIPLLQGGRVGAEIREQTAKAAAQTQQLRRLDLQIRMEVQAAILDLHAAQDLVSYSVASVATAEEACRVESEKHLAGKSTITEVLSAQADLLDAQSERARALADARNARAALSLAIGEMP